MEEIKDLNTKLVAMEKRLEGAERIEELQYKQNMETKETLETELGVANRTIITKDAKIAELNRTIEDIESKRAKELEAEKKASEAIRLKLAKQLEEQKKAAKSAQVNLESKIKNIEMNHAKELGEQKRAIESAKIELDIASKAIKENNDSDATLQHASAMDRLWYAAVHSAFLQGQVHAILAWTESVICGDEIQLAQVRSKYAEWRSGEGSNETRIRQIIESHGGSILQQQTPATECFPYKGPANPCGMLRGSSSSLAAMPPQTQTAEGFQFDEKAASVKILHLIHATPKSAQEQIMKTPITEGSLESRIPQMIESNGPIQQQQLATTDDSLSQKGAGQPLGNSSPFEFLPCSYSSRRLSLST